MRLSSQAFVLSASGFFAYGIQMIVGVILARYFSREEYGTYLQVNLIVSTTYSILLFGIPRSLYYFFPRIQQRAKRGFALQSLLIIAIMGILGAFFLFFLREKVALWMNNPALVSLSIFIVVLPLLFMFDQTFSDLLSSLELAVRNAARKFLFGCLLIASVLSALYLSRTVSHVLTGIMIAYGIQSIFLIIFVVRLSPQDREVSPSKGVGRFSKIGDQIKFALPVGLAGLTAPINSSLNKFVVANLFSTEQFAIFTRGAMSPPFMGLITFSVSDVIQPRLVRFFHENRKKEFLRLWHEAMRKVSLIMYPLFVFQYIFAEEIIVFLYSEKYAESAIIYKVVLFSMLFRVTAWANILQVFRLNRELLVYQWANLVTTTVLVLVLIRTAGTVGAAAAPVIGFALYAFLSLVTIRKKLEISFMEVLPFKILFKILLCSFSAGLVVSYLKKLSIPLFPRIVLSFAVFIVVYTILIARSKALVKDDLYFLERYRLPACKFLFYKKGS